MCLKLLLDFWFHACAWKYYFHQWCYWLFIISRYQIRKDWSLVSPLHLNIINRSFNKYVFFSSCRTETDVPSSPGRQGGWGPSSAAGRRWPSGRTSTKECLLQPGSRCDTAAEMKLKNKWFLSDGLWTLFELQNEISNAYSSLCRKHLVRFNSCLCSDWKRYRWQKQQK